MRKRNNLAFTLPEMLVAAVILSVISFTIYAVLSSGIKIWQRVTQEIPQEDVDMFLEKFASDARNAFVFREIDIDGDGEGFSFATLVNSRRLGRRTVGEVAYLFDSSEGELLRKRKDYSAVYMDEDGISPRRLKGVQWAKFSYYIYDSEDKEYIWMEEWMNENILPLAVRLQLEYNDNGQIHRYTRTVAIPSST